MEIWRMEIWRMEIWRIKIWRLRLGYRTYPTCGNQSRNVVP
jgi:hypothetical protein